MKRKLKQALLLTFTVLCLLLLSVLPTQASTHKVLVGKEITLSFQAITQKNVSWSIQNPNILKLKSTGQSSITVGSYSEISYNATFLGIAPGTTNVFAYDELGNLLASAEVSVENSLYDFKLNFDCLFLSYGESFQLRPTGVPDGVSLIWSSNNSNVSVDQSGIVSLVFPCGISTVTCRTSDGLYSATCTVIGDSPTYFPNLVLTIGEYSTLNYTITVHEDLPELHGTYSSSNPAIVTVDENGVVYAKSVGTATISAQIGNKIFHYSVSAVSPEPTPTPAPTNTPTPTPTLIPEPTATPSPTPAHKHTPKTVTTKATTTKNGYTQVKCSGCGKVISTKTIYYPETISLSSTNFAFNGQVQKPSVMIKGSDGKEINSDNYTVSYSGKCKNAGTYKVVIDFKGKYEGSVTKAFTITKLNQAISAANQAKTLGSKPFSLGAKQTKGNGKLTYKSSNTKVAAVSNTGKITIKGVGKTTITITAADTTNYNKTTKKVTITVNPKGTSLTGTVKNSGSKKMTVQWKRNKTVTGYQIRYSTNSSFKGAKSVTVKKNSTLKATISKLTKGKTYYVQIRTYKTVSGKNYYSGWSTAKKVKITK